MRCLGQINNRKSAEQFVAYLMTQGIAIQVEPMQEGSDQWELWVRDEDRVKEAMAYLQEFESDPGNTKYSQAVREAQSVLQDKSKQRKEVAQNVRRVQYRSPNAMDKRIPPFTMTLLVLSILISIANNFGRPGPSNEIGQSIKRQLLFVDGQRFFNPSDPFFSDAKYPIESWQLWRLITPIFVHLEPLHLVMNMIGLVVLGRVCERWIGTPKYALFVLVAAVLPNALQGLMPTQWHGNPLFGGMSGVVYALFGLVWIRSLINPNLGIYVPGIFILIAVVPIIIGLSGIAPNWKLADLCHLGGLLVGAATAFSMERK
jgi:GlpG protein